MGAACWSKSIAICCANAWMSDDSCVGIIEAMGGVCDGPGVLDGYVGVGVSKSIRAGSIVGSMAAFPRDGGLPRINPVLVFSETDMGSGVFRPSSTTMPLLARFFAWIILRNGSPLALARTRAVGNVPKGNMFSSTPPLASPGWSWKLGAGWRNGGSLHSPVEEG